MSNQTSYISQATNHLFQVYKYAYDKKNRTQTGITLTLTALLCLNNRFASPFLNRIPLLASPICKLNNMKWYSRLIKYSTISQFFLLATCKPTYGDFWEEKTIQVKGEQTKNEKNITESGKNEWKVGANAQHAGLALYRFIGIAGDTVSGTAQLLICAMPCIGRYHALNQLALKHFKSAGNHMKHFTVEFVSTFSTVDGATLRKELEKK